MRSDSIWVTDLHVRLWTSRSVHCLQRKAKGTTSAPVTLWSKVLEVTSDRRKDRGPIIGKALIIINIIIIILIIIVTILIAFNVNLIIIIVFVHDFK